MACDLTEHYGAIRALMTEKLEFIREESARREEDNQFRQLLEVLEISGQ